MKNPNRASVPMAWPQRHSMGEEEWQVARELIEESRESGTAFGYAGPREQAYTKAFAEFLGGGYADAVNSGSNALYIALRALNLEPFHEVIVPPITDPGGVMPVPLNNLIPVPADVAPGSLNVGPEQILARITPQTRAVVVAHISGTPADMTGIMRVAREHGLKVIEDCSQAHGAEHSGRMAGTFGDIGVFSMMNSKHHCMGGQGGMVFTRSRETYAELRRAADRGKPFGIDNPSGNVVAALNCNTDELHCAIGSAQLAKLPDILRRRRESARLIAEGLRDCRSADVVMPPAGDRSSHWFLLLRFHADAVRADKQEFVAALMESGIPFYPQYASQPCRMPWFTERRVFGSSGYPWAAPEYRGDPQARHETPNVEAVVRDHFMLYFNEAVGPDHADWVVRTVRETETRFRP